MTPDQLAALWATAWPVITAIVALASTLDASLPQPAPGSHWLLVRKVISFLAVNVGNASNGSQPSFVTWIVRIATPVLQAQGQLPAAVAPPAPSPTPTVIQVVAPMLAVLLVVGALAACASSSTATSWTPQQTAWIELKIATAAEQTALNVTTGAQGLSPADIADIAAGAATVSNATQASVASLTNGGTVSQAVVSAAVSAVSTAATDLGTILNAKHGASVDPSVALLVAGEAALQTLPAVISAIVQVNSGYQPSVTDINNATADLQGAVAAVTRAGA